MKKYVICVLIADFVLMVCLVINVSTSGNRQETLDLFETFFRYKFESNVSGAQQNAEAYFLKIGEKDPSPEFMDRFIGHSPPVKKGSEFISDWEIVPENGFLLYEKNNGILFRIDRCKWVGWGWITRNHVEIFGGYEEGSLSASWASYIWVRKKGKWKLKSVGPRMVAENGREPNKRLPVTNPVKIGYNHDFETRGKACKN